MVCFLLSAMSEYILVASACIFEGIGEDSQSLGVKRVRRQATLLIGGLCKRLDSRSFRSLVLPWRYSTIVCGCVQLNYSLSVMSRPPRSVFCRWYTSHSLVQPGF